MAFTIGAETCDVKRKHSLWRPGDLLITVLGKSTRRGRKAAVVAGTLRETTEALSGLPESYVVFNGFHPHDDGRATAKWGFDHVVVGPSGVFAIDARTHPSRAVRPARADRRTAGDIRSIQRSTTEFKRALVEWSGGDSEDLFVKPILVYTHGGAYVEKLQEGPVKVVPLRWLSTEITERTFEQLTPEQVYRIARCLFERLPESVRNVALPEIERLGALSQLWLVQYGAFAHDM